MDDFDDLDGLLDMEADLISGPDDSKKRSITDKSSQQEIEAAFGGAAKRPKNDALGIDDDELLEIAARIPLSQSQNPPTLASDRRLDAELQRLAAGSQPSQTQSQLSALPAKKPGAGALRQQPQAGNQYDDDLDIDAALELEEPREGAADETAQLAAIAPAETPTADDIQEEEEEEPAPKQPLDSILPRREDMPPQRDAINIAGHFLTVTSEYGERVYAPVVAPEGSIASGTKVDIAGALRRARGGLLSSGIDQLMAEVEKDQFERALAETAQEADDGDANQGAAGTTTPPPSASKAAKAGKAKGDSALWVDRYAPKGFMDLLSDEQINRDVVHWLKSWDPLVFGRAAPPEPTAPRGGFSRGGGKYGGGAGGGGTVPPVAPRTDELNRPEHKVILLAGPPGLGKTTLAHVVARHCGYRPVEINASDDRSGSALLSRVVDAAEMRSVIGEKLPNCIIIDEIDGAAGGTEGRSAITALLKLVNATPKAKAPAAAQEKQPSFLGAKGAAAAAAAAAAQRAGDDGDSSDDEGDGGSGTNGTAAGGKSPGGSTRIPPGGGKRQQRLRPLLRPIICICNDLYAPALRPLRDVAKVFRFRRPSAEHLAHRLQMVCAAEGLRAEKSTLRMLAERAECDVRSCLNTLQFLSKRQRVVRQRDVAGLGLGQKDMTKGAFQVWGELLQIKKTSNIIGRAVENDAQRNHRLFDTLMDFGEHDLIMGGVHESLPHLRFFDMAMQRTSQVLSHMQDADVFTRHAMRSGDFSLMKYLPATTLSACAVVASPERPTTQWPKEAAEARRRGAANRAVLQQWMLGMTPTVYAAFGGPGVAALDVLPMVPYLTAPALRPVSRHLFSAAERSCVDGLVDTLLSLGLKYSLYVEAEEEDEDEEEGNGNGAGGNQRGGGSANKEPPLQFRPPVHRLWKFRKSSTTNDASIRSIPMAARQMVLHETEMEAIRRSDAARQATAAGHNNAAAALMDVDAPSGQAAGTSFQAPAMPTNTHTRTGHVPLSLAQRLRENAVSGRGAVAVAAREMAPRPGTWLDQMRDKQREARVASATAACVAAGGVGPGLMPVLYKFHEGYTNAVKRPVQMNELLA